MSVDEIKQIMGNFTELDVTKNGLLEQSDVDEWLRWGRKGKTHRGSLHQFLVRTPKGDSAILRVQIL